MTILSEAARGKRIEELLAALEVEKDVERIPVPWQDKTHYFAVIKLPLDHVVLNAGSHRIREQLESHPKRTVVRDAPFSEEGQAIISEILTKIEDFDDLRADLAERGQNYAGVITRSGVLINANTRAVAMRLNDPHGYIRVAVLPANPDPHDLDRLELTLQMQRDFKQDYTFVNQLLFIEDLKAKLLYNDEDVAKAMNLATSADKAALKKGAAQVRQRTRLLALIREVQARSDSKIPLAFFNDQATALEELDNEYEKTKAGDLIGAESMKEGRLLAMLVGTPYRTIRRISADSAVEKVIPHLRQNDEIGEHVEAVLDAKGDEGEAPVGLDELADDPEGTDDAISVANLVDLVAKSWDADTVTVHAADGEVTTVSRDEFKKQIAEEIDSVAEQVDRESKASKSLSGPIDFMKDARRSAGLALVAYQKVAANPAFKTTPLTYELKRLDQVVEALRNELEKHAK